MTEQTTAINYDGRRFTRSDIDPAPIATYRQDGSFLYGSFSGADIVYGCLCGAVAEDGSIHFSYSMMDKDRRVISGECRSEASLDSDGRVHLKESWTRFSPEQSSGVSYLKEIS